MAGDTMEKDRLPARIREYIRGLGQLVDRPP
jgi:hypothetical protein